MPPPLHVPKIARMQGLHLVRSEPRTNVFYKAYKPSLQVLYKPYELVRLWPYKLYDKAIPAFLEALQT